MTQINLLPWREHEKQIHQINFGVLIAGFAGLAIVGILILHIYYYNKLSDHKARNAYLQAQLDSTQGEVFDLEKKQKEETALQSQLQFVMNLRNNSYHAVQVLDLLANLVPSTISLTKVSKDKDLVTIEGIAQSDLEITLFMKNLANSSSFQQPVLSGISARKEGEMVERAFQLKVLEQ